MDVGSAQPVGAVLLLPVRRFELFPVVLHEAEFEDELSASYEAFVGFSPVHGYVGVINVNAK